MTEPLNATHLDDLDRPALRVQGRAGLPYTCEQVWAALNDTAVLQACIPGCERFERVGADHFDMAVGLELGPLSGRFLCRVDRRDVDELSGYSLDFDAQGGALGFFNGKARFSLLAQDSGCVLAHDLEVQAGGRLAQLSHVLANEAAEGLTEEFVGRLQSELQRRYELPPPVPTPPGVMPADAAPASMTLAEAAQAAAAEEAALRARRQAFADDLGAGGERRPSRIPAWGWLLLAAALAWVLIDQL